MFLNNLIERNCSRTTPCGNVLELYFPLGTCCVRAPTRQHAQHERPGQHSLWETHASMELRPCSKVLPARKRSREISGRGPHRSGRKGKLFVGRCKSLETSFVST